MPVLPSGKHLPYSAKGYAIYNAVMKKMKGKGKKKKSKKKGK